MREILFRGKSGAKNTLLINLYIGGSDTTNTG